MFCFLFLGEWWGPGGVGLCYLHLYFNAVIIWVIYGLMVRLVRNLDFQFSFECIPFGNPFSLNEIFLSIQVLIVVQSSNHFIIDGIHEGSYTFNIHPSSLMNFLPTCVLVTVKKSKSFDSVFQWLTLSKYAANVN